jgi:hypothetical protein
MGERVNLKADANCSSNSPRSIARPPLPRNACCWKRVPRAPAIIEAQECGCSTMPTYKRASHYGPEVQHALLLVWNAANRICAKRLIPFLPIFIEATSAT